MNKNIKQILEKELLYIILFFGNHDNHEYENSFYNLLLCIDFDDSNLFEKMKKLTYHELNDILRYHGVIFPHKKCISLLYIRYIDVRTVTKEQLKKIPEVRTGTAKKFLQFRDSILEEK